MISEPSAAIGLVYRWTDHAVNPTGEARAVLRRILKDMGLDGEIISDGVLAVSELVANAHEHACGPYEMHLRSAMGRYICEIHDGDPTLPASLYAAAVPAWATTSSEGCPDGPDSRSGLYTERGRGLRIVHELTKGQWGFRFTKDGTKAAWILLAAAIAVPHCATGAVRA